VHYDGDGVMSELVLSEASMLTLAPAFPRLLNEQLELKRTPQMVQQGIAPLIRALVVRAKVNSDLHDIEVFLHLDDEQGNLTTYGMSPELAKEIGERLIARSAQLKEKAGDRSRQ
jgi:hypothetical protein